MTSMPRHYYQRSSPPPHTHSLHQGRLVNSPAPLTVHCSFPPPRTLGLMLTQASKGTQSPLPLPVPPPAISPSRLLGSRCYCASVRTHYQQHVHEASQGGRQKRSYCQPPPPTIPQNPLMPRNTATPPAPLGRSWEGRGSRASVGVTLTLTWGSRWVFGEGGQGGAGGANSRVCVP